MIKYSFLFLMAFFMVSCTTPSASHHSSVSIPNWYLTSVPSNSLYFYGVGSGTTKKEARSNALADIGGQIATSVSSSIEMTEKDRNGEYSKDLKIQTKSSIDKIKFRGSTTVKSEYIQSKYYILEKVERKVLFQEQNQEFHSKYKQLVALYEHSKASNIFELIKNKEQIEKNANLLIAKLSILKVVSPSFDNKKYLDTLTTIIIETKESIVNANVNVKNLSNATLEAEVLKKYISAKGMTLVNNINLVTDKRNLLFVSVTKVANPKKVTTTNPRLFGAFFADVKIIIVTKDYRGKIVAQNIINVINISKDSYKAAVLKTKKFEREIKKRGIERILLKKD